VIAVYFYLTPRTLPVPSVASVTVLDGTAQWAVCPFCFQVMMWKVMMADRGLHCLRMGSELE